MKKKRETARSAVTLRLMTEDDLDAVLAIEEASFPAPWTRAAFIHELRVPHSQLTVAEQRGQVVGYLCGWYIADEVQILDVAVHSACRRQGVGEQLLRHALAVGRRRGAQAVHLEVRRGNLPALTLYGKFGFREVAVRQRYYASGEDALLLTCLLSPEEQ